MTTLPQYAPFLAPMQPVAPPRRASRVPLVFIISEILFQVALIVPALNGGSATRIVWRVGSFAASLGLLFFLRGRNRGFPASIAAMWVMAILGLSIFHPTTNSFESALAQVALYLAGLAPLFWLSRVYLDLRMFRRIMLVIWAYYSISAGVGVLQVYYPGRFQPALSSVVQTIGADVEGLKITLANGREVFRPMGLTDTPGGAAGAGMWAILLSLGFLLTERRLLLRALCLGSMVMSMMCIYLSQARVNIVVVMLWLAALSLFLLWRRMWSKLSRLVALAIIVGVGGLGLATSVGGKNVGKRFSALTSTSTGAQLYSSDRGNFLKNAFTIFLPAYPLGAGLGRWGMMNYYFGDPNADPSRAAIYVEIQWSGWILDGGIPLTLAYLLTIGLAMLALARLATRRGPLWFWALLILANDVGALAVTFSYTPFTGEAGLEFWFLNALLLTTAACVAENPTLGPWRPVSSIDPWQS